MRSVFLFEHVTGGGYLGGEPPPGSLRSEGAAMAAALATDFAKNLLGVELPCDARLADDERFGRLASLQLADPLPLVRIHKLHSRRELRAVFAFLAARCDHTLIIAPEFDGILLDWVRRAERLGARLLSPGSDFVQLAADKHAAAETLRAAGVAAPRGVVLAPGDRLPRDFPCPAVLKPRDGAGSWGVRFLAEHPGETIPVMRPSRLEEFIPGQPASVAVLYGTGGRRCFLPACAQRLSTDGRFAYLGGGHPLSPPLAERARQLVERAAAALPQSLGYVGFDLVLGEAADGSDDAIIEVNARLTTSYVGLRAACRQNLAAAMLALADPAADSPPSLLFRKKPLEFDSVGNVRRP
jgi:predicted ATP-grasp superfamily ATP-dependent carboligase